MNGNSNDNEAMGGYSSDEDNGVSTYGTSIYPRIQPAYQVERPFSNAGDAATMCVSPKWKGCEVH